MELTKVCTRLSAIFSVETRVYNGQERKHRSIHDRRGSFICSPYSRGK